MYDWRPYVPVAARRRKAEAEAAKLRKKGHAVSPVSIEGRTIARTFWGKSWCENLERYSDYENRLPRGRTYVRNGSVVDLQVGAGEVVALVSGSEVYRVAVKVGVVAKKHWESLCTDCAGAVDSLVELLQGRFSKAVMERLCRPKTGLFPAPSEIQFSCSCPDWASMCKHVAAVLYGIGARLDHEPALLFKLRQVEETDLLSQAGSLPLAGKGPAADRVLEEEGLADLFGVDLADVAEPPAAKTPTKRGRKKTEPQPPPPAPAPAPKARPKRRTASPKADPRTPKTLAKKPKPAKKPVSPAPTKASREVSAELAAAEEIYQKVLRRLTEGYKDRAKKRRKR